MSINKIIISLSIFLDENKINNSIYKDRYKELQNIVSCCCDTWNNVVYAWKRINVKEDDYDPRFYYQSIIFNLYMLGAITNSMGSDILSDNGELKDLRDNIAHMDEKLKKPLNIIPMNDIKPGSVLNNVNRRKCIIFLKKNNKNQ